MGTEAIITGDGANDLLGITMDPNVFIQSAKAVACAIQPGRRPRGEALLGFINEYRERAGISPLTGQSRITYERDPKTMKVIQPPRFADPEVHEGDELV